MTKQIIILLCNLILAQVCFAQIKLPKLISDGMVLQRGEPLKIWGWASAGEEITATFRNKKYKVTTDRTGKWEFLLPKQKAGGPYVMKFLGQDEVTVENIMIGDVYLCSGQSNMVHYLGRHAERYSSEISQANHKEIRQFLVPYNASLAGQIDDFHDGVWKTATQENILEFSVVAYFFALEIYKTQNVPIGIINASVGGSPIETWISENGLKEFPQFSTTIEQNKDTAYVKEVNLNANRVKAELAKKQPKDQGFVEDPKWFEPNYSTSNWNTMLIPGYWEDQGISDLDGVVWFRKDINISENQIGQGALVKLGRIVDADELYVNGIKVGNTTYQYPQRRYTIPKGVLKSGKNTLAIRVVNENGKGGFVSDKPYYMVLGSDTIDLKGSWQYKVGSAYKKFNIDPGEISLRHQPTGFFNGMIAPLTDYRLKGLIWYQGESNAGRPHEYESLQKALIEDWRTQWQKELPFLFVQLPNFMEVNYQPSESNWAQLRQAQLNTLNVPNTAMVVSIELGEWNDIHPGNKKPIGDRLALAARNLIYGEKDIVYSGPIYQSATVVDQKVYLQYDHVGGGLISIDNQPLKWFALAGTNEKYHWADAKIINDQVVLSSEDVKNPVYVRYAWSDNPEGVNFYNKEGLPASPFEAGLPTKDKLWFGKKGAVVLTYDDALDVHLDNAIPMLDSLGLNATFYLTANADGSKNRIDDWRNAARRGHELGNHTLYHPCDGANPDRTWITPENDLGKYSNAEIVREIEMTNVFLEAIDGIKERTFAFTCGESETGDGSFVESISEKFVAMRGVRSELNKHATMNYRNVNCYVVDNGNADKMYDWVQKAISENALLVILFHGVGGGHPSSIDLDKHNAFLRYLKENEEQLWVTTFIEAMKQSQGYKSIAK